MYFEAFPSARARADRRGVRLPELPDGRAGQRRRVQHAAAEHAGVLGRHLGSRDGRLQVGRRPRGPGGGPLRGAGHLHEPGCVLYGGPGDADQPERHGDRDVRLSAHPGSGHLLGSAEPGLAGPVHAVLLRAGQHTLTALAPTTSVRGAFLYPGFP